MRRGLLPESSNVWHVMLCRGLLSLLLGMVALTHPLMGPFSLALFFGVYSVADGIMALEIARRTRRRGQRTSPLVVEGVASFLAGCIAIAAFPPVVVVVRLVAGIRALLCGALEVVWSRRPNAGGGRWVIELAGIVGGVLGVLTLAWPGPGAVALVWLVALYVCVAGGLFVAAAVAERGSAIEALHEQPA